MRKVFSKCCLKATALISAAVLGLALLPAMAVSAEAAEPYTYKLNIYSGKTGTINGGEMVTVTDIPYNARVTIGQNGVSVVGGSGTSYTITPTDERYTVKGVRESGRDNSTAGNPSFLMTQDMDFVVAYNMPGNNVAYTIRYLDAQGAELAPSETYYGTAEEVMVVAYKYIEGYQPNAYNESRTLHADEASNLFTFVYSKSEGTTTTVVVPGGTTVIDGGTTTTDNGTTTVTGGNGTTGTGGTAAGGTGTTGTGGTTAGGNGTTDNAAAGNGTAADNGTANAGGTDNAAEPPREIVNLDEEQVPLANVDADDSEESAAEDSPSESTQKMPVGAVAGICAAVVAVILAVFYALKRRRNNFADRKSNDSSDE